MKLLIMQFSAGHKIKIPPSGMTSCSLVVHRRFGVTYCLHLQGRRECCESKVLFKLDETYICNTGMSSFNRSLPCVPELASLGVKRQRHEVDHSIPSGAEVKNGGSILPLNSICLHGVVLKLVQG
jgi:hypothetical protein